MKLKICACFFSLLVFGNAYALEEKPYVVEEGKLGASLYRIVSPKKWNGRLLLLAQGGRPEASPLSADFKVDGTYLEGLVKEGWLVAGTSYRRNGIFMADGVADVKGLMAFVTKKHGKPQKTYLAGWSMGGKIALKIAEDRKGAVDGVLAIGAALLCGDSKESPGNDMESFKAMTFKPIIPVLFFSNANELELVDEYSARASSITANAVVWTAVRRGHCNINNSETIKAVSALTGWVEKGERPKAERVSVDVRRDGSTARIAGGRLYAKVTCGENSPNLTADITRADLEQAGIAQDSHFALVYGEKKLSVYLGHHYADVKKGEWVSFMTAEDYLRIAMNWDNARKALGCVDGAEIYMVPLPAAGH